jgi:SRSO17 transposase
MRLYVPETWTADPARRRAVGVPDTVAFAPKWQHALALLDAALRAGVRRHVVLGDAAFGEVTAFRDALTLGGLVYLLGVQGSLVVWPPGTPFTVPARRGTTGRPRSMPRPTLPTSPVIAAHPTDLAGHARGAGGDAPAPPRDVARGLAGSTQASRFAAVRVRVAHRHAEGAGPRPELWLLSEWPRLETAPTKYYLSWLPVTTPLRTLVRLAKLRWRVERDYQNSRRTGPRSL